jgi:hypothetical protein
MRAVPSEPARRTIRRRQLLLLIGPTARTIRWIAFLGAAVAADLTLVAARGELSRTGHLPLLPVRVAAVLLCLGAAFFLDDEAGITVEPVPLGLLRRRGIRLALGCLATAVAWATSLWIASLLAASGGPLRPLPLAGLTVEAAALLTVTLATAAVAARRFGPDRGGIVAGPSLLAFVMAVATFGRHWPLFLESSSDPGWNAAHARWGWILATALIVLVLASLDPARRSIVAHRDPRQPRRALSAPSSGAPIAGRP